MSTRIGRKKLDLEHSNRLRTAVQGEYIFFFEHVIFRIFFCHKVSFFFHYLLVVSGDYARSSRRRREPLQSSSTKRKTSNLLSKSFFGLIVRKVLHRGLCVFENLLSLNFFSSSKAIRVNPLSLVSLVPFCLLITFYVFYPDKRLFQDSILKKFQLMLRWFQIWWVISCDMCLFILKAGV